MSPPGHVTMSSVRLSRHAIEHFAERFTQEGEAAEERSDSGKRSAEPGSWAVTLRPVPLPCWRLTAGVPSWRFFRTTRA